MPISLLVSALLLTLSQQPASKATDNPGLDDDIQVICPSQPALHGSSNDFWFEGTFGKRHVRLYLNKGARQAIGSFYSTDDWKPTSFGGTVSATGRLALGVVRNNLTEPSNQDGLKGQISGKRLRGRWRDVAGRSGVPVNLHEVSRRMCDGHGPWVLFSDKRWPLEFSYPADWHIEADDSDLTITCPDASSMVWEGINIWFSKSSRKEIPLQECGGRWIFGIDSCNEGRDSTFVSEAVVESGDGITRFSGWEVEHRVYCHEGGYWGQGDGEDGAIQVGDSWITMNAEAHDLEILPRLNASMRRRR